MKFKQLDFQILPDCIAQTLFITSIIIKKNVVLIFIKKINSCFFTCEKQPRMTKTRAILPVETAVNDDAEISPLSLAVSSFLYIRVI